MNYDSVINEMKLVFKDMPYGVEHTLRVLNNANAILAGEDIDSKIMEVTALAAILHDIGVIAAQQKYHSIDGHFQETEGSVIAKSILQRTGVAAEIIDRVCYIIGNHHTPSKIDGQDFQILWEADVLDSLEFGDPLKDRIQLYLKIEENFRTTTGRDLALKRCGIPRISILLAHPQPKSFNHAIAQTAITKLTEMGCQVHFHDLYAEQFDPILPAGEIPKNASLPPEIDQHCREIASADGIIVIHPNWWGQPPAILKGWIDRVIRPGVAYKFVEGDQGEGVPVGLLKAKTGLVFNTSNTSTEREMRIFGDPLETLWKNCIFGLCGVTTFQREMFNVLVTSSLQQREEWLKRVQEVIEQHFSI